MTDDKNGTRIVIDNPWGQLRSFTSARIALGRAGTSLPTKPHLEFQLAHARARNAVHHELNIPAFSESLKELGVEIVQLHSAASSRPEYLQRPDKGRRLDQASRTVLERQPKPGKPYDVVFVVGDGLSALAIEENAKAFLNVMLPKLIQEGWRVAPIAVVKEARVAVGDEVGEILQAGMVVVLIGERPGLSSPDSLGIYMTLSPRSGTTDEARNCISNVRSEGLSCEHAAHKLGYLMTEARRRGMSGVHLKDEAETLATGVRDQGRNFLVEPD